MSNIKIVVKYIVEKNFDVPTLLIVNGKIFEICRKQEQKTLYLYFEYKVIILNYHLYLVTSLS